MPTDTSTKPIVKLEQALIFCLWAGLLVALGWLIVFFRHENYSWPEISLFLINYLHVTVNQAAIYGLAAGFAFCLVWLLFKRLEGFLVSGLAAAAVVLPIAYYLNKTYFPGRYHPISLVGNGLLFLVLGGLTLWLFLRWFKEVRFVHFASGRWSLAVAAGMILILNIIYLLQPTEQKLQAAPTTPEALHRLFVADFGSSDNGASASAAEEIRTHFSQIANERLKLLDARIARKDTVDIMAEADAAVARTFHLLNVSHTFEDEITWHTNPTKDREWLLALNRMDWIWSVAVAYRFTGDPKYATAFDDIMQSWFEQNPMPRWKNEDDYVWRLIESSARMTDGWLSAFFIFFNCEHVSDEVKWRMLASFHDHAQFLAHFRSPQRNHLLQETYGLLAVGAALPEFRMADTWIDLARLRLDRAMREDVYPDGGYTEGSTYYHRFAIRILQEITDFTDAYSVRLSDFFYNQLEKMYEFLMYTARPDGVMPQMNDGFHAKNLRIMFDAPARMFSRPDFRFFASDGAEGNAPDSTTVSYPYSGIYVMRSDWTADARYMLIDAGPFGSAHGHEDKLSFELFAYGKPFIVESGTYTYVRNRWRRYFTSSFAHNTIVVDGRSQIRFPDMGDWVNWPPEPLPNKWIADESFIYLESAYDAGYGNVKEHVLHGVRHTRRWLFVKPDYWLIWDVVEGEGIHELQQLFHLAPEVEVKVENDFDVLAYYADGASLRLQSLSRNADSLSVVAGREQPIQGWLSREYGLKQAAPTLTYHYRTELPVASITFLHPGPEQNTQATAEQLQVYGNGQPLASTSAVAVKVTRADSSDYILIAPGVTGEKQFAGFETSARLQIMRRATDGSERVLGQRGEME